MPEGDTIFRAARTLRRALAGKRVVRFATVLPALARVDVDTPLAGHTVDDVSAAGKHLLIRFSGDLVLRTHLRMNGSWHIYRPGERWQRPASQMRVLVAVEDFVAVGFGIPVAELLGSRALGRRPDLRRMGPDLLGAEFDAAEALRRLRASGARAIGEALIDQSVVAGAGNIFKSEILFLSRADPFAPVASLHDEQLLAIVDTARRLLAMNVTDAAAATITTYGAGRRTTGRDDPRARMWVYGRTGLPCRVCATAIVRRPQGPDARLTYWCPQCQRAAPAWNA